jgi:hypothetical protein
MANAPKIRSGFLVIADISGYTSFLHETEMEHAQEIIEEITTLLLDHIKPPFKLVKLEGDPCSVMCPEKCFLNLSACWNTWRPAIATS